MALEEDSQLSLLFFNTSTAESSVPSKNLTLDEYINGLREEMIPETIVYTASWFLGTAGNLFILHQLQTSQAHKSKINFLIRHLAIADLMVVWFTITIEIMWRICVTWNTPDLGCRFVQVMRTFGLYLTSMIIISITLDRFYAFVYPMSVFTSKNRNRKFLNLLLHHRSSSQHSERKSVFRSADWLKHVTCKRRNCIVVLTKIPRERKPYI